MTSQEQATKQETSTVVDKKALADEVKKLVEAAQILSIYEVKSSSKANFPPHMVENVQLDFAVTHTSKWGETVDKLNLLCFLEMRLVGKVPDNVFSQLNLQQKEVFEIDVTFCATYLMSETNFSNEAKMSFTETTGTFNTYSYLREYFDSKSRRMGFKPVILPLLKRV